MLAAVMLRMTFATNSSVWLGERTSTGRSAPHMNSILDCRDAMQLSAATSPILDKFTRFHARIEDNRQINMASLSAC